MHHELYIADANRGIFLNKLFLIIASALVSFSTASAEKPTCYDAARAEKLIQEFNVDVSSFPDGRDLCKKDNVLVWFFQAIDFVENLKWDGDSTPFGPQILSNNYLSYIRNSIKEVRGPLQASLACGSDEAVACINREIDPNYGKYGKFGKYGKYESIFKYPLGAIFLTSQFAYSKDLSFISASLIHEARHLDPENSHVHVNCTRGPLKGYKISGCDERYSDGGAHAVEIEYLVRLALHATSLSILERENIRRKTFSRITATFREIPLSPKPTLALSDAQTGQITLYDGANKIALKSKAPKAKLIGISRHLLAAKKDAGSAFAIDPYNWATSKDFAQNPLYLIGFKKPSPPRIWPHEIEASVTKLLDVIEVTNLSSEKYVYSQLLKDRIDFLVDFGPKLKSISFNPGTYTNFISRPSCARNSDPYRAIFLRNQNGDLFQASVGKSIKISPLDCKIPAEVSNEFQLGSTHFRLMKNGQLLRSKDGHSWSPDPNFEGQHFEDATRLSQFYFWDWLPKRGKS